MGFLKNAGHILGREAGLLADAMHREPETPQLADQLDRRIVWTRWFFINFHHRSTPPITAKRKTMLPAAMAE